MAIIKTDDVGNPIPQYYNAQATDFEAMMGSNGAILVRDADAPVNGVRNVKLIGKDNKEVAITEAGLQVILSSNAMNMYAFNGASWEPSTLNLTTVLLENAARAVSNVVTDLVVNQRASKALLVISGTTINITSIDIFVASTVHDSILYKTITKSITSSSVIELGSDFMLPNLFKIRLNHASTASQEYMVELQLLS